MTDTDSEAIREPGHSGRTFDFLRRKQTRGIPETNDLRDAAVVMGSTLGPLAVVVPFFFVFILVGGVILVAVHLTGLGNKAPAAYAIGAILVFTGMGIGAASLFEGPDDGPTYCEEHPEDPACTGGEWRPVFNVGIPEAPAGTGRDAANEVPGSPFTQCASLSPVGTIVTWGTDTHLDTSNKKIEMQVAVDDDLAPTTAGYQLDDCFLVDFSISLENGRDLNGDGSIDAVTYFGRIRSISRTTMVDGNTSQVNDIMHWDPQNGWYIGWMRESANQASNGDWVSAYPVGVSDSRLPTGASSWKQLGKHEGGSAEYISFWFVGRNYGFFGYTQPSMSIPIEILVDVGTPEVFDTWTIQIKLNARG